jgi:hypothetical protein
LTSNIGFESGIARNNYYIIRLLLHPLLPRLGGEAENRWKMAYLRMTGEL